MNKTDLSWLPSIFENYTNFIKSQIDSGDYNSYGIQNFEMKIEAANELLSNIKQFIKDANSLTKE